MAQESNACRLQYVRKKQTKIAEFIIVHLIIAACHTYSVIKDRDLPALTFWTLESISHVHTV